ncbi:coiled-coil domain-containing protein 50 [Entelurus aequoreus]|uniref:coiled-coil domain-containing protein 50 n=1 Tax=Entelurus aequoreus TaxID=161455 RepID=UPI002B1DFC57|nr:coiled-coil domain-containing protein 50 [Entelurus aequoreus]
MAECDVSIDQDKLPGVKDVCRDFAVLEDHSLAYNLQEQEIESHLASNVHKSRLVQQDLKVAKKLQEEEDEITKVVIKKQHVDIERQDNEVALEIQDQLVRQAEQQRRQQEEKDANIARELHEKEMKEERRRKKQLEEEYYEDPGAARQLLDLDNPVHHTSSSSNAVVSSPVDHSPDYNSIEPKRSRHPKHDPAAPHSPKYSEPPLVAGGGQRRHADPYPVHQLSPKIRPGDRYPDYEPAESSRAQDSERAVRRKDRPARSPHGPVERDEGWQRDKRHNRDWAREPEHYVRREKDLRMARAGKDRDGGQRDYSEDGHRHKGHRGRERPLDHELLEPRRGRGSREEEEDEARRARARQRVLSDEVFDEHRNMDSRELPQGDASSRETGRIVLKGSGAVVGEEYGLNKATEGLVKLDLQEQELKDMEVARQLQEEEVKASKSHVRAAQVAQDEEIARLLMEQEKKEYRKHRERGKEREREREDKDRERERERLAMEKMAMERRRPEGDHRLNPEDVVRPRTRDDHDHQRHKNHHKPSRHPQPQSHEYVNINPDYGYPDHAAPQRAHARPEAAHKGAYYKR